MSVANLIDWDKFTGEPIIRTESEQKALKCLFTISESISNFKRLELFKPVTYGYIGQENGKEALQIIIIPEYFEKYLEKYRIDNNKPFLYKSEVITALGKEKIPTSFKMYPMNSGIDKEIFFK